MEDLYAGKNSGYDLDKLLFDCISTYKKDSRYRNDLRFLKIWFLYVTLLKPSLPTCLSLNCAFLSSIVCLISILRVWDCYIANQLM